MKESIIAIVILILGGFAIAPAIKNVNYYATTAEVVDVDYENDTVTFRTWNGFDYTIKGASDWEVDDVASLCINDKGTDFITDDSVINARYSRVDWDSPSRDISIAQNLQKGR